MFLVGSSPRQSIPSIDAPIISSSDGRGSLRTPFDPIPGVQRAPLLLAFGRGSRLILQNLLAPALESAIFRGNPDCFAWEMALEISSLGALRGPERGPWLVIFMVFFFTR